MEYADVRRILKSQESRGADIAKIVTAANTNEELQGNFVTTARLVTDLKIPFLFLCVGDACKRHRKVRPLISGGMYLCVVEHDELATPAQPLLEDVRSILQQIY